MATPKYTYSELLQMLEHSSGATASDRVKATLRLACDGHRGQLRDARTPNVRIPFIVHPVGVAVLAIKYFPMVEHALAHDLETVVCVALTHDLLEDSQIDQAMLEEVAGADVRNVVEALTKPPAGVVGKGKDSRNTDFTDQIVIAGPTAVFVKMCDSMHNMSRPNMTPQRLYRKVVDKAQLLYLPLLARCSLGNEFEQVYRSILSKAQIDALEEERFTRDKPTPQNLGQAISECVTASSGKVLELHDITVILNRVFGTLHSSIWRVVGKNANTLHLVSASDADSFEGDVFNAPINDCPEILKGQSASKFPLTSKARRSASIYTVPVQMGPGRTFVAVLVFDETVNAPDWLTLDAASIVVQFLAHRLIISEADRRARVTTEAARLGIQVDAELASESGITPLDLLRLDRWQTRCRQAIATVENLLRFYLLSDQSRDQLRRTIRIESRVKTVNSILDKLIHRVKESTSRFEEIEDIAGVRAVCPTISSVRGIQNFLKSQRAIAAGCQLHPNIDRPERDWINDATPDGYRAVHLILQVDTYLDDSGSRPVPCEVQLRTVFQDIWATIAHNTAYQSTTVDSSLKLGLQDMGAKLQQCEEIAERIANDFL